jgi:FXSXX-COOH protein
MAVKSTHSDQGFVPVIDVSRLSLAELSQGNHPEMARSLRQVIDTLDDPNGVISAFQSFASER